MLHVAQLCFVSLNIPLLCFVSLTYGSNPLSVLHMLLAVLQCSMLRAPMTTPFYQNIKQDYTTTQGHSCSWKKQVALQHDQTRRNASKGQLATRRANHLQGCVFLLAGEDVPRKGACTRCRWMSAPETLQNTALLAILHRGKQGCCRCRSVPHSATDAFALLARVYG